MTARVYVAAAAALTSHSQRHFMYLEHVVPYLSGVIDGTGLNLVYPLSTQHPNGLSPDAYVLWNGALGLVPYRTVPADWQFSLLVM